MLTDRSDQFRRCRCDCCEFIFLSFHYFTRRMAVGKCAVFFATLTFLWTLDRADAVDCVFMESCILPCSFQAGDEVVIHWIQVTTRDIPVHSYYHNQDQFGLQDRRFSDRTSVFEDQISRGNASLRLTKVEVQDQGSYKCYTSTITGNKELLIKVNVDAPVRKVDIQQVGNRMTCSSEGIYPKPELTWTTNPPSNMPFQNKTTVQQTDKQLYNISSSLMDSVSDMDYSCTVSTRSNRRTTTLFKPTSISGSQTETTIPCTSSNTQRTGLIWRFNHSQIILVQTGANVPYSVSEDWTQLVKRVSESGNLTLQDLSSDQEGIYSCELSDAEAMYITTTTLRIQKSQGSSENTGIIIGVVIAILATSVLVGVCIKYRNQIREKCIKTETQSENNSDPGVDLPLRQNHEENNGKIST